MLRRLGHTDLSAFHMNEGHAALLSLALLEEQLGETDLNHAGARDIEEVREKCVFTTHTPVPAGHDQFSRELMRQVIGPQRSSVLEVSHCCHEDRLNMTFLALRFSRFVNGVAMRHGDVLQEMFPWHQIRAITNGVHARTWAAPSLQAVFDRHLTGWREDNVYLRYAIKIPVGEIHAAHSSAKAKLLEAKAPHSSDGVLEQICETGQFSLADPTVRSGGRFLQAETRIGLLVLPVNASVPGWHSNPRSALKSIRWNQFPLPHSPISEHRG